MTDNTKENELTIGEYEAETMAYSMRSSTDYGGCDYCDTCQTSDSCQTVCQVACQETCESSCQVGCQVACQTCDTCQSGESQITNRAISFTQSHIEIGNDWEGCLEINITPTEYTPTLIWSSSNEIVAGIDSQTGEITPRSNGTTTITVETMDGYCSATCTVKVDMREKVTIEKVCTIIQIMI